MAGAPTPQKLLEAIAANAAVGPLPGNKTFPMPETQPVTPNAASIQTGFNALVMTNENAGGRPPLGPDMNGLWFLVSSHTLYVECGQTYKFDSDIATAIGGYALGTILGMTDGTGLWLNNLDGNTNDPDAGGAGWVPLATYGFANIVGLTGGTVNLTAAQAKYGLIVLNGILAGNLTINFPTRAAQWLVVNRTSGAFTTTAKTASVGSTGVVIPQGGFAGPTGIYYANDGNIYPTVPPLGVAIDQNPTPLTLVERTNAGYILATYFNQNSALENPTVGAVFVQNSANDGFLRKISLTNLEAQMLLQGFAGQLVNGQVPFSVISQWASALFNNAALTGVPTTPTAAAGTSNSQVASTAFANPGVVVNANGTAILLPNGYKIQLVLAPNLGGGGSAAITWPVAFTNTPIAVATSIAGGSVGTWFQTGTLNRLGVTVGTSGGQPMIIAAGL